MSQPCRWNDVDVASTLSGRLWHPRCQGGTDHGQPRTADRPSGALSAVVSWIIGREDQGGSTIDQQLAKNLYTGGHSGFAEDLKQLALAVKLNQAYSRAEILRMYAEVAYYGHGYYGLDAASCGYFGRPPERLTLVQAAMLAGVVNAPSYDDPLAYPRQARTRLVHVIGRMAAVGYLTRAQETAALNAPLGLSAVRGCP